MPILVILYILLKAPATLPRRIPLKVNIHAWRLEMDRLPTKKALARRNISMEDLSCVFCRSAEETSDHVFTGCLFACGIWQFVEKWCGLEPIFFFDIEDIMKFPGFIRGSKWKKEIIRGILMTACWLIWRTRNKMIFDKEVPKVYDMIACRTKFRDLSWQDWSRNPLYIV